MKSKIDEKFLLLLASLSTYTLILKIEATFVRNVGFSPNCKALQPKNRTLHNHSGGNLKSSTMFLISGSCTGESLRRENEAISARDHTSIHLVNAHLHAAASTHTHF